MDVKDAILSRRTIFKFEQKPVPDDVIEQVFSFGIWAPNHHVTEPWRFIVIGEKDETNPRRSLSRDQDGRYA